MEKEISHTGTVKAIQDNRLSVDIVQISACCSCQARKLCSVSDMKEKTVNVTVPDPGNYHIGQEVTVRGSERQGLRAVWLAFGLPLVLALAALAVSMSVWNSEKVSVLSGLAVLVAYWAVLFLFRERLGRSFSFSVTDGR